MAMPFDLNNPPDYSEGAEAEEHGDGLPDLNLAAEQEPPGLPDLNLTLVQEPAGLSELNLHDENNTGSGAFVFCTAT